MPIYFSLESPGILVYYISSLGLLRQTSTSRVAYSSRNLFSKSSGGKRFKITRCQRGRVLFRSSGGRNPFCPFQLLLVVDILWHSLAPGYPTPTSASIFTLSSPLRFCVSKPLHLLSYKICIMASRVHQFIQDKILLSRRLT